MTRLIVIEGADEASLVALYRVVDKLEDIGLKARLIPLSSVHETAIRAVLRDLETPAPVLA